VVATLARRLFAFSTVPNYIGDGFLDAAPVVALGNGGSCLVDAGMGLVVHLAGDLVLALGVRDDLLVVQHQDVVDKLVVGGSATQPAFFGSVSAVGIATGFEVEPNLVETLFTHKFLATRAAGRVAQVASVDDGVHQPVGVALEVAGALDTPNALEAQRIPDLARRHVGLVDQVEHRVLVAQLGRPIEIRLAH